MKHGEYEVIGLRRFHELRAGDMFRATLYDIRPGEVTIKFTDGKTHTARTLALPDARIGEESIFAVRENDFEGRIILEMVRPNDTAKQENLLREVMYHAGLPATTQLLQLGHLLLDAGLPADGFTLQNPLLYRLLDCPLAILHADPHEAHELARYILRNARRRTYHRINRCVEAHIFKASAGTTVVLTALAPALGRVEITIELKAGFPVKKTFRAERERIRDLLSAHAPDAQVLLLVAPFTLLSPPPEGIATPLTPTRYNFDIRV